MTDTSKRSRSSTRTRPPARFIANAPEPPWVSVRRASEILGVTPEAIRYHIQKGRIPASRIGGGRGFLFIRLEDVREFMRPRPVTPGETRRHG